MHCDAEKQFFDFGEAYADSYIVRDGGEKEMFSALRTLAGPAARHQAGRHSIGLKTTRRKKSRRGCRDQKTLRGNLLRICITLLKNAQSGVGFPAESLKRALLAFEDDDMERFKEKSSRAVAVWKNRVKEMEEGMGLAGRWEQAKLR